MLADGMVRIRLHGPTESGSRRMPRVTQRQFRKRGNFEKRGGQEGEGLKAGIHRSRKPASKVVKQHKDCLGKISMAQMTTRVHAGLTMPREREATRMFEHGAGVGEGYDELVRV
eukprot:6205000-Pleurochrysis_carterae.AAC.3